MADLRSGQLLLGLLAISTGCPGEKDAAGTDETGSLPPLSPCSDGTWGALDDPTTDWDSSGEPVGDPATAIQVRADGDDDDDGTIDAPVATLERALALSRLRGSDKVIFLGPGTYEDVQLSVAQDPGDGSTDDGLVFAGCRDEVTLEAGDDASYAIRVTEAQDVRLFDLEIAGGARALWIWGGAHVSAARIAVRGSRTVGVVIDGPDTVVDLSGMTVSDTEESDDSPGLAIGAGILKASVRWSGGTISHSRTAGMLYDGDGRYGSLEVAGLGITDTTADDDGAYGRGVQIQNAVAVTLSGCEITDSADAGVFVLQSASTILEDLVVTGVSAAEIPGESGTTGDGVVVTSDDGSGAELDPSLFDVSLTNSVLSGYVRAGALVEDVEATLSGNEATGGLYALAYQGSAIVGGDDAVELPAEALGLNREGLDLSFVTSE